MGAFVAVVIVVALLSVVGAALSFRVVHRYEESSLVRLEPVEQDDSGGWS
jgi:hypothetical protein